MNTKAKKWNDKFFFVCVCSSSGSGSSSSRVVRVEVLSFSNKSKCASICKKLQVFPI